MSRCRGGVQIDEAVAALAALEPARLAAALAAAERLEADREATLKQWRLGVERASYEASRAERRYRAVDPDNRLVARGLEREWEESLSAIEAARVELARREEERPRVLSEAERKSLLAVGPDLTAVWNAPTTSPRHRKELLRTLLEEVIIKVERDKFAAHLTLRWKGGALGEIDLPLPRSRPATIRADEATIALVRRLAVHYPDTVIGGILNRRGRRTARGHRFDGNRVGNLRRHWNIPCFEPRPSSSDGERWYAALHGVASGVDSAFHGCASTTALIGSETRSSDLNAVSLGAHLNEPSILVDRLQDQQGIGPKTTEEAVEKVDQFIADAAGGDLALRMLPDASEQGIATPLSERLEANHGDIVNGGKLADAGKPREQWGPRSLPACPNANTLF